MIADAINGQAVSALSEINGISIAALSGMNGLDVSGAALSHPTWTGVSNATNSSGVLTKTSANNWDMGAVSNETLAVDARFVMYVENFSYQYMVGVGLDSSCVGPNAYATIDHAVFINFAAYNLYENGNNVYGNTMTSNCMFVIERIGTTLNYYVMGY